MRDSQNVGAAEADDEPILIVGASARAAVESAQRASIDCWAADLFGDQDLIRHCRCQILHDWPGDVVKLIKESEPVSWMYTGGLENWPLILKQLENRSTLLGCHSEAVALVRDPFKLQLLLRQNEIRFPETQIRVPDWRRRWLRKPLASCGGIGISEWTQDQERQADQASSKKYFYQQLLPGACYGAVFVGFHGSASLQGVTHQVFGQKQLGAGGFKYCGSFGPAELTNELNQEIERIGRVLAVEAGLVGLFGVDLLINGNELSVLEVNPRYTASIEVLELALNDSLLRRHLQAFKSTQAIDRGPSRKTEKVGKVVIYHSGASPVEVDEHFLDVLNRQTEAVFHDAWIHGAWIADIPTQHSIIHPEQPICSLLAQGTNGDEVMDRLFSVATRLISSLRG